MQHLRILRQQSCPGCGRTCPKWNRRGHLHAVRLRFGNCGFRNSVCDNSVAPPKPYISLAGYNWGVEKSVLRSDEPGCCESPQEILRQIRLRHDGFDCGSSSLIVRGAYADNLEKQKATRSNGTGILLYTWTQQKAAENVPP